MKCSVFHFVERPFIHDTHVLLEEDLVYVDCSIHLFPVWLSFLLQLYDLPTPTGSVSCMRCTSFHSSEATTRYPTVGSGLSLDERAQRISTLQKKKSNQNKAKNSSRKVKSATSNSKASRSLDTSHVKESMQITVQHHLFPPSAQATITTKDQTNHIPKASILYHPSCHSAHDRHAIVSQYHFIYKLREKKGT